jgi:predicted phosphoribosyltransferase
MTTPAGQNALYPSRSGAGSTLGRQLYQRVRTPVVVWAVTPSGVEMAATAAEAMKCQFDVVVGAHVRLEDSQIVGAMAEDAEAVLDPKFAPKFSSLEMLEQSIDRARRAIKQERLLFRGQRNLRAVASHSVVIIDGHVTNPWKLLAAAKCAETMGPAGVVIAAAVSTQPVQELIRARRLEFVCPSVVMDPKGHPMPFGDPQDPSAERLRSIVVARQAA